MKIAVMGAGAVGCYYGGMLARGGHQVTLIARPAHVEAIQRDGLRMDTTTFQAMVPMEASTDVSAVAGATLVLFCVKSTDTADAATQIAPHLAPDALVLSLQNGVDNAERAQALLPGHSVLPVVVYVATEMAGPGHVKHHGRGELVIGPGPQAQAVVDAFAAGGIAVQVSDNVTGALWAKLVVNCAFNAISAITQLPYGKVWQGEGAQATMRGVVDECLAVAEAAGIRVPGDGWQAAERIAQSMPGQFSSTAQDLGRGKRSEIDHLNGHVVRVGERVGVAAPLNRALHALVKLIESRDAAASA